MQITPVLWSDGFYSEKFDFFLGPNLSFHFAKNRLTACGFRLNF